MLASLPPVKADRVQLQQVMLNLIMNAMDALRDGRTPPKEITIRSRISGSQAITVEVEDRGIGIDPQIMDKIFDPFFTTKPHGIGMGLSISRSIIESHHGQISAKAALGDGALFQFTLPVQTPESNA